MKIELKSVPTNFIGFNRLISAHHKLSACAEDVELSFSGVDWFDANMCAVIGAILESVRNNRSIKLTGLSHYKKVIMEKNCFLTNFGFDNCERTPDLNDTTIEYCKFSKDDVALFKDYVREHFIGKNIPQMSQALQGKFRESIFEIFENAVFHSKTELGIFACGQYYPKKDRLNFTIVDRGIGIKQNFFNVIGIDLIPSRAIQWAMEGSNTTKRPEDGTPGGIGLKLIKDFIILNKGKIQIVSDTGYWCLDKGIEEQKEFNLPFPGTIVDIEINTADKNSYCLNTEIDPKSIF